MNNCTFYTIDCCFKTNKNVKQLGHQVIFVTYPVPFLILGKLKPYSDVEAPFRIKIYQYLHNNIACMLQFINHQNFIYTWMRDQYHSQFNFFFNWHIFACIILVYQIGSMLTVHYHIQLLKEQPQYHLSASARSQGLIELRPNLTNKVILKDYKELVVNLPCLYSSIDL